MNNISEININDVYIDKHGIYKSVIITEKTASSVRFQDQKGYYSWVYVDKKFFERFIKK